MKDLITFLDNNVKSAVYTGVKIHGLYFYLDIIESLTALTNSDQCYNHFGPLSYTNNDT